MTWFLFVLFILACTGMGLWLGRHFVDRLHDRDLDRRDPP